MDLPLSSDESELSPIIISIYKIMNFYNSFQSYWIRKRNDCNCTLWSVKLGRLCKKYFKIWSMSLEKLDNQCLNSIVPKTGLIQAVLANYFSIVFHLKE